MKVPMLDLPRQQATFGDGLIELVSDVIATGQYLNNQWPTLLNRSSRTIAAGRLR